MLSENDYNILNCIYNNRVTNEKLALTLKDINQRTNISISTIRKSMQKLTRLNYLKEGLMHWKAKSYYITQDGISYIEH